MQEDVRRIDSRGTTENPASAEELGRRLRALLLFADQAYDHARAMAEDVTVVLAEALSLDIAYLRLHQPTTIAVASAPGRSLAPDQVSASGTVLERSGATSSSIGRIPEIFGDIDLRVHSCEFGEQAVLAGASRRPDFPTALDRELVTVAARLFEAGLARIAAARAQRRQNAQRAVAEVFASARTTAEAAAGILRAVCEHLEWSVGSIWIPDARGLELQCVGFWHSPALPVPEFEAASRQRTFQSGIGLPGRVWSSGRPHWIPEVTRDSNFPRAPVAEREGLHAALGFPIRLGDEILGVLEFFSERMQEPDEDLLAMMTTVGLHLGQFLDRSRVEETRQESEHRFAGFMQHLPGLAWLKDREGRYIYANDKAVEVFRIARERLYGHTDDEVFPPATAAQFKENDRNALSCPAGVQVIETLQHADGVVHLSLASKFPIAGPDGTPAMVGGIALDITDQLRTAEALKATEERLTLAVQEAGMATWDVDVASGNGVWSETHFRILGYEPVPGGTASHDLLLARIHPDDRNRVVEALEDARRHQLPYKLEYRVIRADNADVRWISSFGRFRVAATERFVGVMFDNTERRRAEEALKEADRRKDEFLALLAHELRNPLGPIRNASHLLRIGSRTPADIDRIQLMLERQVWHMVRLVDDLLDVSRISRGRLELQKDRVDLSAVVSSAVETMRPIIETARHRLTVELPSAPVLLHADAVRLSQVLANLLHNAAKYTAEGGDIAVSVRSEGDRAVVRVRDTGIGIPAALLPRIFDMFSQGDSPAGRSQGGLGVGLTIARNLVELHGGTIEAASLGIGKGTEFVVHLPLSGSASAPERRSAQPPDAFALNGCRVLIVEDNRDARDSLALILQRRGMEVRIADDGAAALDAVASAPPDVILLDIAMPGMDGYELARRIRQRPELDRVTLIALTGFGQVTDRERCLQAGFDHHVVKPADPDILTALLASIARHSPETRHDTRSNSRWR